MRVTVPDFFCESKTQVSLKVISPAAGGRRSPTTAAAKSRPRRLPATPRHTPKRYINDALQKTKLEGKMTPAQLKGYKYDVGHGIGASKGKEVSTIKIQIDSNGNIHAHPWSEK